MKIGDTIQTLPKRVITATSRDTIGDVVYQLKEYGIGAVVVSDDGAHIAGILSERDIVRYLASEQEGALRIPVGDIMTVNVTTTTIDADVDDVLTIMTDGHFRHIPIVDDNQELVAIASLADLIMARLDELRSQLRSQSAG